MTKYSLGEFEQLDRDDPMSPFRDKFFIPDKLTYLNGNSLGAMPSDAVERTREIVAREWGERLIRSWNESGWYHSPERIGNKIAQFIGADAGEVICTDATGINLFKVISMALQLQPVLVETITATRPASWQSRRRAPKEGAPNRCLRASQALSVTDSRKARIRRDMMERRHVS